MNFEDLVEIFPRLKEEKKELPELPDKKDYSDYTTRGQLRSKPNGGTQDVKTACRYLEAAYKRGEGTLNDDSSRSIPYTYKEVTRNVRVIKLQSGTKQSIWINFEDLAEIFPGLKGQQQPSGPSREYLKNPSPNKKKDLSAGSEHIADRSGRSRDSKS